MSLDWEPVSRPWLQGRGPTMRPPSRFRSRVALVAVALGVGFLVGVQARESGERASRLSAERPEDLARILTDLNAEADRLAGEVAALRLKEGLYGSSATREDVLLEDARKSLADLQVLSGTVAVRGPGVLITISDTQGGVGWESLLDTVQELRDAGAEAIAIGGLRVVASTWLGPAPSAVSVDGAVVRPPYEIEAIGDARALRESLQIAGGPLALIAAQPGVRVDLQEKEALSLLPLQRPIAFRYARPA